MIAVARAPFEPESAAPSPTSISQTLARLVLATALVLAGLWILREFIAALVWAGIFAIALWPLYRRLLRVLPQRGLSRGGARRCCVTAVALVFILPLVLLGNWRRPRERISSSSSSPRRAARASRCRIGSAELPLVGPAIAEWWRANLGDPAMVQELFGRFNARAAESARQYGGEIAHRLVLFGFTC